MRAVVYENYGSPDLLELTEIEKPVPKDDEVLVKIHAVSVNPLDRHALRADPFFMRLMGLGLFKPKNKILGSDISGTVEAVGKNVAQFKPGDEVFGGKGRGGFAEYICLAEDKLELKPGNLSFEQAASVLVAGLTALQGLRDTGEIQENQQVLINGASGGVGTFAIQIAKHFGAEVTAICSTDKIETALSCGADHVIDYTQENFLFNKQRYDLIFAVNGNNSIAEYKSKLKEKGIYLTCGGSGRQVFSAFFFGALLSNRNQKIRPMMAKIKKKDLGVLKELLETNKIVPVIDKTYELNETAEAIRYIENGHAKGKVIVKINSN